MKGTESVWFECNFLWMNMPEKIQSLLKVALRVRSSSNYVSAGNQKPEELFAITLNDRRNFLGCHSWALKSSSPRLLKTSSSSPLRVNCFENYPSLVLKYLFREGLHNSLSGFVGNEASVAGCSLPCLGCIPVHLRALATLICPSEKPAFAFWPNTFIFFSTLNFVF